MEVESNPSVNLPLSVDNLRLIAMGLAFLVLTADDDETDLLTAARQTRENMELREGILKDAMPLSNSFTKLYLSTVAHLEREHGFTRRPFTKRSTGLPSMKMEA